MPEFVIIPAKKAARLALALRNVALLLDGVTIDPKVKAPARKPRKARTPKLDAVQSSVAQFQK